MLLFCLGLLAIVFAYGVAVGKYRFFPHDVINGAGDALQDWRDNWRQLAGLALVWVFPPLATWLPKAVFG